MLKTIKSIGERYKYVVIILTISFAVSEFAERVISNKEIFKNTEYIYLGLDFLNKYGVYVGVLVALIVLLWLLKEEFFDKWKMKKIINSDNFLVIIGLSKKNQIILDGLLKNRKNNILIIERNEKKLNIDKYKKDKNVVIKYADAKDENILKKLNLTNAKKIYISTSDDEINDKIEDKVLKLSSDIRVLKEEKKIPRNIKKIDIQEATTLAYHKYLSEEKIPFISRIQFKRECKNKLDDTFKTEEELFEELFFNTRGENIGLIIKGEGGVGKTRLMLELGRHAKKKGWETLQVLKDFNSWEDLNSYVDTNKKYCLIFDYIEESKNFSSEIATTICNNLSKLKTENLKIIANARNTYVEDNPRNFIEYDIKNRGTELEYLKYVVKKILEKKVNSSEKLEKLQNIFQKPSMAIFLLESPTINDFNFKEIKSSSDFIRKRINLTFNKHNFKDISKDVFYLFASLPIAKQSISQNSENKKIVKLLQKDGWIDLDENKNYISKYNDTIIDTILFEYLKNHSDTRDGMTDEFIDLFDYASKNDINDKSCFFNAFRSLERISDDIKSKSSNIDYVEVFDKHIEKLKKLGELFAKTPLLTRLQRIKMINEYSIIPIISMDYGLTLSRIMDNSDEYKEDDRNEIILLYKQWIQASNNLELYEKYDTGSYLIQSYYSFFGKESSLLDINYYAEEYLHKFNRHQKFAFVLDVYIKNNGYSETLDRDIKIWVIANLNKNISDKIFQYFCRNFDDKLKPLVLKIFEDWINNHVEHKDFPLLLQHYLKKSGDFFKVKQSIVKWINLNGTEEFLNHKEFNTIVKLYLKNKGDIQHIASILTTWLNNNINLYYKKGILSLALESGLRYQNISSLCIESLSKNKQMSKENFEEVKDCLDKSTLTRINFQQYIALYHKLKKIEPITINSIEKKLDKYLESVLNNNPDSKDFKTFEMYISVKRIHRAKPLYEDENIQKISIIYQKYFEKLKINEKNYIKNFQYFMENINNKSITIATIESILNKKISVLVQYYLTHENAKEDKIKIYFQKFIMECSIYNWEIKKNIVPIFKIYFEKIEYEQIIEDEIEGFIKKNMKFKEIIYIILLLTENKFDTQKTKILLDIYLNEHTSPNQLILEKIENFKKENNI